MASESGSPDHPNDFRPPTRGGEAHPNQPNPALIEAKLQLTRDEIRVLKECNQESFWYRCVPLSIALATATHLAVQKGFLKGHPTRGALGKSFAAIGLGYVLGKWSYQKVCRDKILALDNSPLANAYRRQLSVKQGGSFTDVISESFPDTTGLTVSSRSDTNNSSDYYHNNEINTDSNDRYAGLDDSKRPNLDTDAGESPLRFQGKDKQSSYTSYEELRKKNREEYVIKNTPSTRMPQSNQPVMPHRPDVSPQSAPSLGDSPSRSKHAKRNQYGDLWDE